MQKIILDVHSNILSYTYFFDRVLKGINIMVHMLTFTIIKHIYIYAVILIVVMTKRINKSLNSSTKSRAVLRSIS